MQYPGDVMLLKVFVITRCHLTLFLSPNKLGAKNGKKRARRGGGARGGTPNAYEVNRVNVYNTYQMGGRNGEGERKNNVYYQ